LDRYPFAGHSALMGKCVNEWQAVDFVLGQFAEREAAARRAYRDFLADGISLGRRPELVGGGLIRSLGGWTAVKSLRDGSLRVKGDERILGESGFVLQTLASAEEELERVERLVQRGVDLDSVARQAAGVFGLEPDTILGAGRQRKVSASRSLFCYWAVRELGHTTTALARRLKLTQPAVSIAVRRGERIVRERGLRLAVE